MAGSTTGGTSPDVTKGITIAGFPVLVDVDGEAQAWLDRFMPEATIFRSPQACFEQYLTGPNGYGEFFQTRLPELPPIKIGQLQWPCTGVSRYARAMYLVDRISLFQILHEAWGATLPTSAGPWSIPSLWNHTKNKQVPVFLLPGVEEESPVDLSILMYVLTPIRISDDLWILPLVDGRYFRLTAIRSNEYINELKPTESWSNLFAGYGDTPYPYSIAYDTESGFANPDTIFKNPQVPDGFLIDAAAFSVGCRPVVPFPSGSAVDNPHLETLEVVIQNATDGATAKTATQTAIASSGVSGGFSGQCRTPRRLTVSTRFCPSFYSGENKSYSFGVDVGGKGSDLQARAVMVVSENTSTDTFTAAAFEDYVVALKDTIFAWGKEEYYACLADLVDVRPGGFDDYIIFENSGDDRITIIRSLPSDFCPAYFLAQHASSEETDTGSEGPEWFCIQNQTVVAKTVEGFDAGAFIGGVRAKIEGTVQIIHGALLLSTSDRAGGADYIQATTTALNGDSRTIPSGAIVHMAWVEDVVTAESPATTGPERYTGWVIDWADCA